MTSDLVPRVGGIPSADIAVPDHEREVRFHASVLGTGDRPLWRPDLMNNRGQPIIGLGARTAEHAELPLQWMPHVQVADVATSAARAIHLGGRELMHGRNADGGSQWAVLADPDGAAFGVIPAPPADEDADADVPVGRIAWISLSVPDAAAARDFYQQVIGWSVRNDATDDAGTPTADATMLGDDGTPVASIGHDQGANRSLPRVWLIHLPVGDLAESLRRVRAEGGEVVGTAIGPDGTRSAAVIRAPAGAHLALVPASHH
jgi:predicted enzyme related to lactoylglutathione lyase